MVVIDMEMPESCWECPLNWIEMGKCMVARVTVADDVVEFPNGSHAARYGKNAHKRSMFCPLREIEEK